MKRKYERISLSISKVRRLEIELDDLNIPFNIEILWFTEIATKIVMDWTKLDELKALNDINWLEVDIYIIRSQYQLSKNFEVSCRWISDPNVQAISDSYDCKKSRVTGSGVSIQTGNIGVNKIKQWLTEFLNKSSNSRNRFIGLIRI